MFIVLTALTFFNSQGTEVKLDVKLDEKVEIVLTSSRIEEVASAEDHKEAEQTKYASFFDNKQVTPLGILPLPERRKMKPIRKTDSDVPEMFYTAGENVSPHDFDYISNPYAFCTDVDEGTDHLLNHALLNSFPPRHDCVGLVAI